MDWIDSIISAWTGHRKFAEFLVEKKNPDVIVELGVDYGYSTFVFANALQNKTGTGTGSGMRRPSGPRSTSAITAGRTRSSAAAQSMMPPPAIMPSSATPTKLVMAAEKKATAVVMAPVRMPGPTAPLVSRRAFSQENPRRRISRYRPT